VITEARDRVETDRKHDSRLSKCINFMIYSVYLHVHQNDVVHVCTNTADALHILQHPLCTSCLLTFYVNPTSCMSQSMPCVEILMTASAVKVRCALFDSLSVPASS
jgi:hypothetical protein